MADGQHRDPLAHTASKLVTNTYVTLGSTIAVVTALCLAAYKVGDGYARLDTRIHQNTEQIGILSKAVAEKLVGRGPDGWHKVDQEWWIREAAKMNEGKGLVFPPAWNSYDRHAIDRSSAPQ